jgi:hypothetical protein
MLPPEGRRGGLPADDLIIVAIYIKAKKTPNLISVNLKVKNSWSQTNIAGSKSRVSADYHAPSKTKPENTMEPLLAKALRKGRVLTVKVSVDCVLENRP